MLYAILQHNLTSVFVSKEGNIRRIRSFIMLLPLPKHYLIC